MKNRNSSFYFGSLQAFFFAIGMYFVALVFAFFLCSTLFYGLKKHDAMGFKSITSNRVHIVA